MNHDWNGNGKHDLSDQYIDYRLSGSGSPDTKPSASQRSSHKVPTWLLVGLLLAITSGEIPASILTVIIGAVIAITIWIRIIS